MHFFNAEHLKSKMLFFQRKTKKKVMLCSVHSNQSIKIAIWMKIASFHCNCRFCAFLSALIIFSKQIGRYHKEIPFDGSPFINLSKSIDSLIRGVLIQICSAGAKNFTNYVFCHPQCNSVVLSKILKIVVPFWPCLSMLIIGRIYLGVE